MSKFYYEDSNTSDKWSIDFEYDEQTITTNLNKDCKKNDILYAIQNNLIVSNGYTINVAVNDKKYMLNPEKWIIQLSTYLDRELVDTITTSLCNAIYRLINKTETSLDPLVFVKNDSTFKVFTVLNFEKENVYKARFTVERTIENDFIHNLKETKHFTWNDSSDKNLYDFLGYNLIVNYNLSLQDTTLLIKQFADNLKTKLSKDVKIKVNTDVLDELQFTFPADLFELFCEKKDRPAEDFLKYYKGILMKVVCKNGEEYEVNNAYYDLERFFHEILNINRNTRWKAVCQTLDDSRK